MVGTCKEGAGLYPFRVLSNPRASLDSGGLGSGGGGRLRPGFLEHWFLHGETSLYTDAPPRIFTTLHHFLVAASSSSLLLGRKASGWHSPDGANVRHRVRECFLRAHDLLRAVPELERKFPHAASQLRVLPSLPLCQLSLATSQTTPKHGSLNSSTVVSHECRGQESGQDPVGLRFCSTRCCHLFSIPWLP